MKQMIGISVGSQNTVVGVLKNGNVDIILSETSSRCVPTISAFQERERAFGDSAFSTIKSNFNRTVVYPNRWLGIQSDWPFLQEETKYATAQPQVDKHNKIGFEINYKNDQDVYYPESLMGLFFDKLKQNWKNAGYDTREVVVSVPDYYTAHERKAMLDALTIADLSCTALLNESSAIAIEYGLKRRIQFDEKVPKIVAFVDMGQSKTTISFASFTKNTQKVISVTSERFCGAREFDYLLMAHFSAIFQKKYGCNPMNSTKCRLRLMDAIAKVRKTLTVNREANINVESLMEDEDLNHNLTRDEFEQIIAPVTEKFRNLLKKAIDNAMAEGSKIKMI
jgi:heat shock 70kDa protein 4